MLTSLKVEWPESFYEMRRGVNCFMCAEGRPEENPIGLRIFSGEVSDAYLRRANIQRGLTIQTWRGPHVAEPTELDPADATGTNTTGKSVSRTFRKKGTFTYICGIHGSSMKTKVKVV